MDEVKNIDTEAKNSIEFNSDSQGGNQVKRQQSAYPVNAFS